jgi:hypothetical protein
MPEALASIVVYADGDDSSGEEEELCRDRRSSEVTKDKKVSKKRSGSSAPKSLLSALKKPSGPPPPSPSCMPPPSTAADRAQAQQQLDDDSDADEESEEKDDREIKLTATSVATTNTVDQLAAPATPTLASPPDLMRHIIAKQRASGTWTASDVADLLQITLEQLTAAAPALATEELWATAVASAYLVSRFADHRVTWELVVRKATKHIARSVKSLSPDAAAIDWHQLAVDFVSSLP